jgi:D-alanyl-D-alanine carboxypeptidase
MGRRQSALVLGAALVGALAWVAPAGARTVGRAPAVGDPAAIEEVVDAAMARSGVVGLTVAVTRPGRGIYRRSWGMADRRTGERLTPDHHILVGSVTKTFTAVALLRLVQAHRVALDEPVARYVDLHGVPHGDRITIRQLLGMRAGLFEYFEDRQLQEALAADPLLPGWDHRQVLDILRRNPPAFAPDERTEYSNSNYIVAGLVIEAVTGRPVDEALDRLISEQRLPDTALLTEPVLPPPFSRSYQVTDPPGTAEPAEMALISPETGWTAGAVVSDIDDVARWTQALATGRLLDTCRTREQRAFAPLTGQSPLEYGLGLVRIGDWLGHHGSVLGYNIVAASDPATSTTVVVFTNTRASGLPPSVPLFLAIADNLEPGSVPGL